VVAALKRRVKKKLGRWWKVSRSKKKGTGGEKGEKKAADGREGNKEEANRLAHFEKNRLGGEFR